jgi:CheY-like chemotaxis protein
MALKIMVVDDEPGVLKLIKTMVEPLGIKVVTIADSREASARLEREKFDGIFVDVRMPHMDGFELTTRVRASRSNGGIPIVMLTGLNDVEAMRQAFKVGVTFFLNKPFTRERVTRLLKAARGAMLRENRRYARLPLQTTVNCRWHDNRFKSTSLNISESGMLLESPGTVGVGQELELEFAIPQVPKPLTPRAQVVRKEPPDRIGIRFSTLAAGDREVIQRYISAGVKE